MKDYCLNDNDKKDFILSYDVKGDKIFIKYANGKKYENFYTKELEKDILLKMREQVLSIDINKLRKIYRRMNLNSILIGVGVSIFSFSFAPIGFAILITLGSVYLSIRGIKNRFAIFKDYKKNKSFIDNMEVFQGGISNEMGMYTNLNLKTKKNINRIIKLKEHDDEIKYPNINVIDKIDADSYYEIYDLLMKNKEFSKYYENGEVKRKVLKK